MAIYGKSRQSPSVGRKTQVINHLISHAYANLRFGNGGAG